ncbi:MAG: MFS transporter [Candidatus Moranbacteria bacterium]|nr:MFS transporter [Candidatus Moranbacteria bacterium]
MIWKSNLSPAFIIGKKSEESINDFETSFLQYKFLIFHPILLFRQISNSQSDINFLTEGIISLFWFFPYLHNPSNIQYCHHFLLMPVLTISIFLGKGLGGIIADKFGWMRVAILSLISSAIILPFGSAIPLLGIFGIFLFNITMPITLVSIVNLMPG